MTNNQLELKKIIATIVCVDNNFGIGKDNNLLIKIPDDLKRFSRLTNNGIIIMGKNTFESLPKGPLPNRTNFVITHFATGDPLNPNKNGITTITMEQAKEFLLQKSKSNEECKIFVIGGGKIYEELLPYCDTLYLTKVLNEYDADTYFPNVDEIPEWNLISTDITNEYNGIKYQYCIYKK